MSESIFPMPLELRQLGAMPAALRSLLQAYHPLVKNLFLAPSLTFPCCSNPKSQEMQWEQALRAGSCLWGMYGP